MTDFNPSYQGSKFSHIYVEERAAAYPLTGEILRRFPNARLVYIKHYKDLFNRPRQDFQRQKAAPKLILAEKGEPFVYKGPDICENFGYEHFYYASTLLNCLYHCDYCYLQGLYPSANLVAFVNTSDFFEAVKKLLSEVDFLYLCASYDTDLLAFEGVVPYTKMWIDFAREQENLLLEVRTKSANYRLIRSEKAAGQVVLSWTLSPEGIARRYERLAPPLKARLEAAREALEDGWKVRLSLEPMLQVKDWRKVYGEFIDQIFQVLPADRLFDVNLGVFRMNKEYFKRIEKSRTDTDLFCFPMSCRDGVVSYEREQEMKEFLYQRLREHCPEEKIYG